jgi:FkbM family methyltransferase
MVLRNLSAIPGNTFLGKVLRLPLRLIPGNAALPVLAGRLRGYRWIAASSTHGCWLGTYEYEKQVLFETMINEGSTVFDIGANVGFYTLLASSLTGPNGKVVAFEPVPRNLHYLKQHLHLNQITNVTVIEAAVADQTGTTEFDESNSSSTGRLAPGAALHVDTVTLDQLVNSGRIPVPDYIKIDVEGAEARVLSGAMQTLTSARPKLFLATHGEAVRFYCRDLLGSAGYCMQSLGHLSFEESDEFLAFAPD